MVVGKGGDGLSQADPCRPASGEALALADARPRTRFGDRDVSESQRQNMRRVFRPARPEKGLVGDPGNRSHGRVPTPMIRRPVRGHET